MDSSLVASEFTDACIGTDRGKIANLFSEESDYVQEFLCTTELQLVLVYSDEPIEYADVHRLNSEVIEKLINDSLPR